MPAFMYLQSAMSSIGFTSYAEVTRRLIGSYDNQKFNQDRDNAFIEIRRDLQELQKNLILDYDEMTKVFSALQPKMMEIHKELEVMKLQQSFELAKQFPQLLKDEATDILNQDIETLKKDAEPVIGFLDQVDKLGKDIAKVLPNAPQADAVTTTKAPEPKAPEPEPLPDTFQPIQYKFTFTWTGEDPWGKTQTFKIAGNTQADMERTIQALYKKATNPKKPQIYRNYEMKRISAYQQQYYKTFGDYVTLK
jgi:hypothetical protein